MIELKNVNKYFYHHKKNEVHVINNTSLKLPDKGLVAILGESGSGKTTLLNVIGGLDGYNSGKVIIDGKRVRKCNVDRIRNTTIGYVFQDYKLIDNLSVFENVALSLRLCGMKNKAEIKERVDYVLNVLNLYRYRKREVTMLSGGERQRVGIARAIVKNPHIVICDEPTGNLDSKNSIQIMNIIKHISKERLVLLVTHEEELANFYADRIIKIQDGVMVSDTKNEANNELNYEIDDKIYLKDFNHHESFNKNGMVINYYADEKNDNKIDIVFKNGSLYINTNVKKTEVINDSGLELVDDHHQKIDKSIYEKYEFKTKDFKKKNASLYHLYNMLKVGFRNIMQYSFIKKALLGVYVIAAICIMYAISSGLAIIGLNQKKYYADNHESYVSVNINSDSNKKMGIETYNYIIDNYQDQYNYVLPSSDVIPFDLFVDDYFQTKDYRITFDSSLVSIDLINADDIILGEYPKAANEVVIDKLVFEMIKGFRDNGNNYSEHLELLAGIFDVEDIIGREIRFGEYKYTIVGIVDNSEPCVYLNMKDYVKLVKQPLDSYYSNETEEYYYFNYLDYEGEYELVKGSLPVNDYEVIIPYEYRFEYPLNKNIKENKIAGTSLKVVGYYKANNFNKLLVNLNTSAYELLTNSSVITISSNDPENLTQLLKADGRASTYLLEKAKTDYKYDTVDSFTSTIEICGVIFIVVFVEIIFMTRSSFLSRIKEIGIMRAIGVKKSDIYKMFISEAFVAATIGNIIGSILMYRFLIAINNLKMFAGTFYVGIEIIPYTFIVLYIITILIACLPIHNVIKRYPAQILSRKDI